MEYYVLMDKVLHLLLAWKTQPIAGSQEQLIEWLGTIQVHRKSLDPPRYTRSSDSFQPLQKQAQTSHDSASSSAGTTVVISVDPLLPLTTPLNLQTLRQMKLITNSHLKQVACFLRFAGWIANFKGKLVQIISELHAVELLKATRFEAKHLDTYFFTFRGCHGTRTNHRQYLEEKGIQHENYEDRSLCKHQRKKYRTAHFLSCSQHILFSNSCPSSWDKTLFCFIWSQLP